jgi:excisionase family DNA binding protein
LTQLLLTSEAARILGIAPATVHSLVRRGHLRAKRTTGGVRVFRREDVERLLVERREAARRKRKA